MILLEQAIKGKEERIGEAFPHTTLGHRGPYYTLAWVRPSSRLPPSLLIIPTFPQLQHLKSFASPKTQFRHYLLKGALILLAGNSFHFSFPWQMN